jgi:hypothetical protein
VTAVEEESFMTDKQSNLGTAWWAKNLDDVDREVARLATICNARILDPGVIERRPGERLDCLR